MTSEFLTADELARRLCVSRRTLFRLVSAGKFPQPVRITARTVRWRWGDVEAYLSNVNRPKRRGGANA